MILDEIKKFSLIYIIFLLIIFIMKRFKIDNSKLLILAGTRMTIQLILAGYILTYIFTNTKNSLYTFAYLGIMLFFTEYRVISKDLDLNLNFKLSTCFAITVSYIGMVIFFIVFILKEDILNPRYAIPISGMLLGNTMNSTSIAIKNFCGILKKSEVEIQTLMNLGAKPKKIVLPFIKESLETALIPTINSMLGMGVVVLPGMMTGQILAGSSPMTAIFYQLSITIAISGIVCFSTFLTLILGYKSFWNKEGQFIIKTIKKLV